MEMTCLHDHLHNACVCLNVCVWKRNVCMCSQSGMSEHKHTYPHVVRLSLHTTFLLFVLTVCVWGFLAETYC